MLLAKIVWLHQVNLVTILIARSVMQGRVIISRMTILVHLTFFRTQPDFALLLVIAITGKFHVHIIAVNVIHIGLYRTPKLIHSPLAR